MAEQTEGKLNWLERHLPEGLLADSAWLTRHGYSTALRNHYVSAGWLEQPARRVYRRPRGQIDWQQAVVSMQSLLGYDLAVGGRTALELKGFGHYLARTQKEVHLYGPKRPPTWLATLPLKLKFSYHNDGRLFTHCRVKNLRSLGSDASDGKQLATTGLATVPWGQWNWPMVISTPERAVLELLDELPERESFHQADMLMEGLSTLSPSRLQQLLVDCHSVKVKRLFFFFAERHNHAWLKRLDRKAIDFGKGKRMLVPGGKLDTKHLITVPGDLNGPR